MFRAKYKTGSECILPKHNDNDFLLIYDTREEGKEALIHNRDHSYDWHYDSLDRMPKVFLGCYIYPFMQYIEGEHLECIEQFSIFEHEQEYKDLLVSYFRWLPIKHKWWYHIVIAYFMFKKGEMSLTEEEREIAQETHDNGISKELFTVVVEYFASGQDIDPVEATPSIV